ncbi:MAG: hypothetical protein AAB393_17865 [Bacteroidota bacterium]
MASELIKTFDEPGEFASLRAAEKWLKEHGFEQYNGLAQHIFDYAKHSNKILADDEIETFIETEVTKTEQHR